MQRRIFGAARSDGWTFPDKGGFGLVECGSGVGCPRLRSGSEVGRGLVRVEHGECGLDGMRLGERL